LDCFDGCSIVYEPEKPLRGEKEHPITQGFLCPHLTHWFKHPRITSARVFGKKVSLQDALDALVSKLKTTPAHKTFFYKGSGNLGAMQSVTKLFFEAHGGVVSKGSLCDEGGAFGIVEGRGANLALSPLHVKEAEVVVLWGRNPTVTNTHMLPALKGKTVIVIDPVATMPSANLHLAVKPRGDLYLALLLARIAYMEELEENAFIEARTDNFEAFKEIFLWTPIVSLVEKCGISLEEIAAMLGVLKGKKVAFLVGTGVQRYRFAHQVMRAIDSFAAMMGWLGSVGSGVGFLSDSVQDIVSPFAVNAKTDSAINADFSKYDMVVVQGGNPATQMPHSPKVREGLKQCPCVVYVGLHENATSAYADIVIPAKSFLEKTDIKFSYGHEFVGKMPKLMEANEAISEYELCTHLMEALGHKALKTETAYLEKFLSVTRQTSQGLLVHQAYNTWPYATTFYTPSGKFKFLEEVEDGFDQTGMWLVFAKWPTSLNSQFSTHQALHVHPALGLKEGERVRLSSKYGTCEYCIANDARLREDMVLLYSGHADANMLTPPFESDEGHGAAVQEVSVFWERA
jgi:anaerobic selenocysteine-containing dehydrogenase